VDVHINLVGRHDLAAEIYRQLRAAIVDGRLLGDEPLPPTRELAQRLSVSRTTVTVAYDRLIGEGFAHARVGSGTFVSPCFSADKGRQPARHAALRPRPIWDEHPLPTDLHSAAEFDFRPGVPDARLFPYPTWRRLLAREFRPSAVGRGGYGDPAGHAGLREAIAHHFGISRGIHAQARDVIVTNGTQQAVDLIARVLVAPGDAVAVEDPGYGPPRRLLASLGLRVARVPVDGEGLVVDAIPAKTRLIYLSPSHQFPLGVSMSLRRRIALLEWANRTGCGIIEDDYDSEFRFGGRPIEPLQALDAHGRVVYVGSFSKTMLPTLRLGFLVAPPSLRDALETAKYLSDWHSPLATQAAMARFVAEGHFARHVRRMRTVYQARHALMIDSLARSMADHLEVVPSAVGLHLAAFARGAAARRVDTALRRASSAGVACYPLSMFSARATARPGLVLGYGAIAREQIDAGIARLSEAFQWACSVRRSA
jgi:GntR family transcriptional regulator/MocR family aminotransferase